AATSAALSKWGCQPKWELFIAGSLGGVAIDADRVSGDLVAPSVVGTGLVQQRGDVGPELLPAGAVGGGHGGEPVAVAHGEQIRVVLPDVQALLHHLPRSFIALLDQPGISGQVGAEPVVGTLLQPSPLLDGQFLGVHGIAGSSQGGAARGLVAVLPSQV